MLLPGRRPELAALGEVIALHELPLAHVAAKKCAAVLVNAVAEVLTRHAAAGCFPALQLAIIHEVPIVHNASSKYICTNASGGWAQWVIPLNSDCRTTVLRNISGLVDNKSFRILDIDIINNPDHCCEGCY